MCRVQFCSCVQYIHAEVTAHSVHVYLVLPERHHALQIVFLILKPNNPLIEFLTDGSPRSFAITASSVLVEGTRNTEHGTRCRQKSFLLVLLFYHSEELKILGTFLRMRNAIIFFVKSKYFQRHHVLFLGVV
jgi:hypothetical protein